MSGYSETAGSRWRQPEIPVAPVPAIEVVQEFRMLERATRHGTRNTVQAFAGAHPRKYLLVLGSSLPSKIIWPLEKARLS